LGQKKSDPHERLELLERVSAWGTLVILAGILIEVWLFFAFDPRDLRERGWTLAANVLIALGLIAEYVAIRMTIVASEEAKIESDEKIAASEARAAEATERALATQLELEKFRRPWELPVWKLPQYSEKLAPFSGTPYIILTLDDHDPRQMAVTLRQAFSWAQWAPQPSAPYGGSPYGEGIALVAWINGVDIRVEHSRVKDWWPAAQAIAEVFSLGGIDAKVTETDGVQANAIHVFIGRKT
jgi:hypothetical protein